MPVALQRSTPLRIKVLDRDRNGAYSRLMSATDPLPRRAPTTVHIQDRALDNLRYIREAMESSASFTAVSGYGGLAMGASALLAAGLASLPALRPHWLTIWVLDAVFAALIGGWATWRKAR